jgi:hypothetical protein
MYCSFCGIRTVNIFLFKEIIMISSIVGIISKLSSLFNKLQVKQLVSIMMVSLVILATNVSPDRASKATVDRLDRMVRQENSDRPKTTAQWQKQAEEVEGRPGERLKRIGEQSADAVKEFGSTYPDVAKKSAAELRDNVKDN